MIGINHTLSLNDIIFDTATFDSILDVEQYCAAASYFVKRSYLGRLYMEPEQSKHEVNRSEQTQNPQDSSGKTPSKRTAKASPQSDGCLNAFLFLMMLLLLFPFSIASLCGLSSHNKADQAMGNGALLIMVLIVAIFIWLFIFTNKRK